MKSDTSRIVITCPLYVLCTVITALLCSAPSEAGPITSSGLNTTVSGPISVGSSTQYNITGGTRPGGGTNLFHSFGDFNVPNNNIANFLNNSGLPTSNILGRVTGGNISNIFGTIQTTGFGNANLFLMNPAGFLFGPNASINVGGMVSFTSADYLRLSDGARFNAIPNANADALLSASPVAAFGFLGSNPGAITVQGSQLTVTPGQSLSFVGGNITVQSGTLSDGTTVQPAVLTAQGGQINLASVASPGEVLAGTLAYSPNVNGQSFGALGVINISEQSHIDASGNGGGTVLIRGGNLVLDNSTISANVTGPGPLLNGAESIGSGIDIQVSQQAQILPGSLLETNVVGNATPSMTYGGTHIKADRIEIIGDPSFNFDGPLIEIHSDVASGSTGGNSGAIQLEGNSILLQDFVTLNSSTRGAGNAGNIILRTSGNLEINGSFIQTESDAPSPGNAGNIELSSAQGSILMTNAPFITSQAVNSTGNAGTILVKAPNGDVLLAGVPNDATLIGALFTAIRGTGGTGGSGGIQITANNLTVQNATIGGDNLSPLRPGNIVINLVGTLSLDSQSVIETSGRSGGAPASDLTITAHDVLLTNNSGLFTNTFSSGAGGLLNVFTETLQLTNGGSLTSGSHIQSDGLGLPSGPGGAVLVQGLAGPAHSILIDGNGSGIFTNTEGTGAGGNANILAQSVTIQNGGTISAATTGTAPSAVGGNIAISTGHLNMNTGGTITASTTGPGNAGNVTIQGLAGPAQSVLIDGGTISTDTQGSGAGGNITINANQVTLQNSGMLTATTAGASHGGDIQINASTINLLSFAAINTLTLGDGAAGNISLKATDHISSGDAFLNSDTILGAGVGGTIHLSAPTIDFRGGVLSTTTSSLGGGNAGNILLEGQQINVSGSASINASTDSGTAHGGTIVFQGLQGPSSHADNVTISGNTTVQTVTGAGGSGSAGDITINAGHFTISDHSQLNAGTFGAGGAGNITINATQQATILGPVTSNSDPSATGHAGGIFVSSPTVLVQNGGNIATSTGGQGAGGNINIIGQSLTLTDGAHISASSTGSGSAGNITINAGNQLAMTNSSITTEANQSSGGAIKITTNPNGGVQLNNSTISASVLDGAGGGGSVNIDPQFIVLQNNSQILANAVQGPGGNISLTTNLLLQDASSVISASSQFGQNGTIAVQSPISPASGKIIPLSQHPLIPVSLMTQRCAALSGGQLSSFTVAGRETLPAEPGAWMSSPLALNHPPSVTGPTNQVSNSEEVDQSPLVSLRQIAPPGFLTQAFAEGVSEGCHS
ncbi:MAG TPA: filamentous hemagglutinin N-terminal domain-containing protein [Nitrospira sp.]|nr:filamentous hemagglutinin N-terminal domain-containing protein [Nitrospira sp.]